MCQVRSIAKAFGPRLLFKDITFGCKAGTLTVVTGPPGSGKTTLLRCIAGVEKPDDGTIEHVAPILGLVTTIATNPGPLIRLASGCEPATILVDEPTLWMTADPRRDPYADRLRILVILEGLLKEGHAIVAASHDPFVIGCAAGRIRLS